MMSQGLSGVLNLHVHVHTCLVYYPSCLLPECGKGVGESVRGGRGMGEVGRPGDEARV